MRRVRQTVTGHVALLVVFLASCAQPNGSSAQSTGESFSLDGTEWVLESLNGEPLLEDTNITLEFEDESLNGYSGCNWYGGPYKATAMTFSVVEIVSTQQACTIPVGAMRQEGTLYEALGQAATYRVTGDRLEFVDSMGDVTLTFTQKPQLPMNPADLVGTKWRLRAVSGEDVSADAHVTLNFPAVGIFNGVLGCIDYNGKYTAEGDDIWFGEYGHNYARCSKGEKLDGIEAELTISGVTDYRLRGTELELLTYTGDTLLFIAR